MAQQQFASIEKSNGPTYTISKEVLQYCELGNSYIAGDTVSFPYLTSSHGLNLIKAQIMEFPSIEERDEEEKYDDINVKLCLTVNADANTYQLDHKEISEELSKNVNKWIIKSDEDISSIKILSVKVVETHATHYKLSIVVVLDFTFDDDLIGDVIVSPFDEKFWHKHMDEIIKEGVCYVHEKVPVSLRDNFRKHIDEMVTHTVVDYHPNSNDIVRDIVHPALYPYIKGVSKFKKPGVVSSSSMDSAFDFWGRKYEDSKFQWLPTPFSISKDGKCVIQEYINNLDRDKFADLYSDLESLFTIFLPYFEEVWSYAKTMDFFKGDDGNNPEDAFDTAPPFNKVPVTLRDRELQVITKIVDYTLKPGQSYEGVWHAEGMSHENIVMTGLYFLGRDEDVVGGDLRFKRAFTVVERNQIFFRINQSRPVVIDDFVSDGFVPLGKFPTEEGYLLVFPNCHIHKIAKMVNTATKKVASRRVVVFFVVNPEKKIISTREVPKQQNIITLSKARRYRLDMMSERKYDKEKLNVRDIELCEH